MNSKCWLFTRFSACLHLYFWNKNIWQIVYSPAFNMFTWGYKKTKEKERVRERIKKAYRTQRRSTLLFRFDCIRCLFCKHFIEVLLVFRSVRMIMAQKPIERRTYMLKGQLNGASSKDKRCNSNSPDQIYNKSLSCWIQKHIHHALTILNVMSICQRFMQLKKKRFNWILYGYKGNRVQNNRMSWINNHGNGFSLDL